MNFVENFAPVIKDLTQRNLIVVNTKRVYYTIYLDIETAFLHGNLEKEICMSMPEELAEVEEKDLYEKMFSP